MQTTSTPTQLELLHCDNDIVVVNKPTNLLSVPGLASPHNLFDQVKAQFPTALVVHRLDMATSGLMIFALNKPTQSQLGRQFERRAIKKMYVAVVHGHIAHQVGEINSPLICDWENRPKQKVDWLNGKPALTQYAVANQVECNVGSQPPNQQTTRVHLFPHTGRSHQLRVHMQQIGHPIVGDFFYAPTDTPIPSARLLLHAQYLNLSHPSTGAPISFSCPAPF